MMLTTLMLCATCAFSNSHKVTIEGSVGTPDAVEAAFRNPPPEARPCVWYHVMNGNASHAGLTKDFEAMAHAGIGGATLFDVGCGLPPGPISFASPAWFDFVEHGVREAKRLGLSLSIANCAGWSSSAGPWVSPVDAMKVVTFSRTDVKGPRTLSAVLPREMKDNGFYADIAVVAVPSNAATVARHSIDLTSALRPDGTLDWQVPAGDWAILRFGCVCNGRHNKVPAEGGDGLEVDKLSADAVGRHFDAYVGRVHDRVAASVDGRTGLTGVLIDSYEVGKQNWTIGLEREFAKRRGYALVPWLPVLAGFVVEGKSASERFMGDFDKTVGELFVENYAGTMARCCRARGLELFIQPYGNMPAPLIAYGREADVPMCEFWSYSSSEGPRSVHGMRGCLSAPSLAHVWGRRFAAAEACTAHPDRGGRWLATPFSIKALTDAAFGCGVNRFYYHRFAHQPWTDDRYRPGMTMGRWGVHFDRTQTWWDEIAPVFFRYQARCQAMLQLGENVAQVLVIGDNEKPGSWPYGYLRRTMPRNYGWDYCDASVLERLRVEGDQIVSPGGARYDMLYLRPEKARPSEQLQTVRRLAAAGARVSEDASVAQGLTRFAIRPDAVARTFGDEEVSFLHRRAGNADWYFVALNNATNGAWLVSFDTLGRMPEIWNAENGSIRDADNWWTEEGRTCVVLDLPPSGSAFVVFRNDSTASSASSTSFTSFTSPAFSTSPWRVSFPGVGEWVMTNLVFWTASDNPDIHYFSGTATYSVRLALAKPPEGDVRVVLNLGTVREFAQVTVNGRAFEPLWRPPYEVDVTDALRKDGTADLTIRVTNLWPNRLIGDDRLCADDCEWKGKVEKGVKEIALKGIPDWVKEGRGSPTGRHTFTTWKHWDKSDEPLPSGLLGPVTEIRRLPIAPRPVGALP